MSELRVNGSGRPRLLFCTGRPSRYSLILVALRSTFNITVIDNGMAAADAIESSPDVLLIEEHLIAGDGLQLAQTARQIRRAVPMTIVMIGPKKTTSIGRLLEEGIVDAALTGKLSPGEFLDGFWRQYGSGVEDAAIRKISAPAALVLDTGRELFTRLEDIVSAGGIDREARKSVSLAAESVVTLADDPSVAPMLNQLRGHHDSTFAHSLRVGILMASFGRAIGVPPDQLRLMAETGLLHDLGKMKVPLSVLSKPGRLTDDERVEMNLHPEYGAELVAGGYRDLPDLVAAVKHHHEKLDGSGYPDGQAGSQIHEMSLCTAVVDVFSALTDRRDYKAAMTTEDAFGIMAMLAGPHLEPRLFRRFRELVMETGLAESAPPIG